MLSRTRKFILEKKLIQRGDKVLAAVSGGGDSVAMAILLSRLQADIGFGLALGWIDHRQNEASRQDGNLVAETAARLEVPFHSAAIQPSPKTGSREGYWRDERYRILRRMAEEHGLNRTATGHTRDDQAETVLLRLQRGTGVSGLAGIPAERPGGVVRPLLGCGREELRRFLIAEGFPWQEDPTNLDISVPRNRIRHVLIRDHPGLVDRLVRVAEKAGVMSELVGRYLGEASLVKETPLQGIFEIDLAFLRTAGPNLGREALRAALCQARGSIVGISRQNIEALAALSGVEPSSRVLDLPGLRAYRAHHRLFLVRPEDPVRPTREIAIVSEGDYAWADMDVTVVVSRLGQAPIPLMLRTRRPGDRLWSSSVRLKTHLIKRHVPRFLRDRMPLLASGSEVVWLPPPLRPPFPGLDAEARFERGAWWNLA